MFFGQTECMKFVATRAVEPEPKQFWMTAGHKLLHCGAGAGTGNLGSGSTAIVCGASQLYK